METETLQVRITTEHSLMVKNIVLAEPENFSNVSHYIRCLILKDLRQRGLLKNTTIAIAEVI
jgi:hypothetical protein